MTGPIGSSATTFAARLRAMREAAALTQEELAERAGLSAKAVGALERGERTRPYPHTVRALADALDLDGPGRAGLVAAVPRRPGAPDPAPDTALDGPGEVVPTTLRVPETPLVGRDDDVDRVCDLVAAGRRVVTLTGPGGVGKTRLALAVTSRLTPTFDGGSVVVDLAPVRDPALVLDRVAATLGLGSPAHTSTATALATALAGRPVLVVLDNLEQVVGCAPDVAALVAACPELVVLGTSRAALRIRAEHEVVVAPLAVPARDADKGAIVASAAGRLFLDRCAAVGAPLELTDATARAVVEVCRRLDGLPLALELAASSMRLLSPQALLDRLTTVLDADALRDLPDRQRTMSAVLDWSLDLLGDDDRRVFTRLAVFSAGFSLDAAAAVAATTGVEANLASLVDQSLVLRGTGPDGQPRLRLLEPVRQDAMARLHRTGRPLVAADRHAIWFRDRAVLATGRLRGPGQVACHDELSADHADLRAALLRLVETERGRDATELLHGIWLHLAVRGHAREGLDWARRLDGPLDDTARAYREVAMAGLHYAAGDIPAMRDCAAAALVASRRVGRDDLALEASVLAGSGAAFAADHAACRHALDEAAGMVATTSDPWARAHLAIAEAQLAVLSGRPADAGSHLDLAEGLARERDDAFTLATALNLRATTTELAGDHAASAVLLAEATERSVTGSLAWTLAYALPALASAAAHLGDDDAAATLFGAAASVSAAAAVDTAFPTSRELAAGGLAGTRARLGEARFRRAWDAGRVATRPDVVALARELSDRARG